MGGSFDDLKPGAIVRGPAVTLDDDHLGIVREVAGYTHPLFNDREFVARSPFPGQPLPGQWSLFLLGGLAERSGAFGDDVIALAGIDQVRFPRPALVGDTLHLEMEVLDKRIVSGGRKGIVELAWRAINQRSETTLTCRVSMMFRIGDGS